MAMHVTGRQEAVRDPIQKQASPTTGDVCLDGRTTVSAGGYYPDGALTPAPQSEQAPPQRYGPILTSSGHSLHPEIIFLRTRYGSVENRRGKDRSPSLRHSLKSDPTVRRYLWLSLIYFRANLHRRVRGGEWLK